MKSPMIITIGEFLTRIERVKGVTRGRAKKIAADFLGVGVGTIYRHDEWNSLVMIDGNRKQTTLMRVVSECNSVL